MAVGLAGIHGEYRVDQQHTGARPGDQAACLRRRKAEIGFTLFIDIAQAAGQRNAGAHGKGQAVGLFRLMVGILSQNNAAHPLWRRQGKSGKYVCFRRINWPSGAARRDCPAQCGEIGLFQLFCQQGRPARIQR